MNYIRAHRSLIRAELVTNGDKYRQTQFISQPSLAPAFIDQNSSNSARQKLHTLAIKLRDDCYRQEKASWEIVRDFLIGAEKIRGKLL